ncbi:DUF305 domain-containing protein [Streptomyces mirabilis]|uniref:Uncharacterized conserved protein, DUF305 family n=1 Tax=Streptomyces mirabilis TaxID=68239 RepID=A0A1I2AEB6_9ACTN|nr:DUF305 domain-containing protein [Streptomyces mirabilis]SFE42129.1 Uncharacterized conserved protein, DUF305 family [Streptomyces mirabilis]
MTAFTRAFHGKRLHRKPVRRVAAIGVVAAGALMLSACGGDSDGASGMSGMDRGSKSSATATAADKAGDADEADVTFAQMMIPHHEQAVAMAQLADGRASDAEIKDLAAKIEKAQDPEIKTMTSWLNSWGKPTATGDMPGMGTGGDGMMSDKAMKELKAMQGKEFDKMFAQMMIDHHNGAIAMAKTEQKSGRNPDPKKMADAIVTGQSAEVKQLKSILDRL